MIFLNILISFTQIFFIPGLLYTFFINKFNLFLILSVSVFSNYILILILSLLKIYTKDILLIIISIETLIILFFLIRNKFNLRLKINFNFIDLLNYLILLFIILKLVQIYYPFFGSIFSEGDVIRSWNEWSYNLFGSTYSQEVINYNTFDSEFKKNQSRSYYGQLIPALWSIFYILTENGDVTLFPKLLNFTLCITVLFYLIINFVLKKKIDILFVIIFLFFLFYKEHAYFIYSGLVDGVIAALLFLSLLLVFNNNKKFDEKNLFAGIIYAVIVSNIKISALYYSLVFLPFYLIFNYYKIFGSKLFKYLIFLIFFSLFWFFYQYIFYDINILFSNNIDYLKRISANNISDGYNLFLRLFNSEKVCAFIISILIFSVIIKEVRYITLFLIVPYIVIWYNFSSYDVRNLLLIIPVICFVVSKSIIHVFKRIKMPNLKKYEANYNMRKSNIIICIFVSFIIIFPYIAFNQDKLDNYILKNINDKKINLKDKNANKIILDSINNNLSIYSDYIYIKYILTNSQFDQANICSYFQKKDFSNCRNLPEKGSILLSYYNNNKFINEVKKKYSLEIIYRNNNFKIFKFK